MKQTRHTAVRSLVHLSAGAALVMSAGAAMAQAKPLAGQTVKMMWIDPLTGLMGPVGGNQLKSWQFFNEKFNATNPAGVKFEIIGVDNKLSPTESLQRWAKQRRRHKGRFAARPGVFDVLRLLHRGQAQV